MLASSGTVTRSGEDGDCELSRLRQLFDRASQLPADKQEAFVRGEAGEDDALAEQVLGLLRVAGQPTPPVLLTDLGEVMPDVAIPLPERFGSFVLHREIDRGGMGVVYEAEDTATGQRVALKRIRRDRTSKASRERFVREARLGAAVNDPHCVFVFAGGVINGDPYITMELLSGANLQSLVAERGRLGTEEAIELALEICQGIAALHEADIVHRDLKPANCLLAADGTVKVGDMGLSRTLTPLLPNLTSPGLMIGTPAYAPPEQLRGDSVDQRADVYGVCATLYFMLTGEPPFCGGSYERVIAQVAADPAPSLRSAGLAVTVEFDDLLQRGLAKDPATRPASVATLADQLAECVPGRRTRAMRWPRLMAGVIDFGLLFLAMLGCHVAGVLDIYKLSWQHDAKTLALVLLAAVVYFTGFEGRGAASPGKRWLGLSVQRTGLGGPIGHVRAALRAVIVAGVFSCCEFAILLSLTAWMNLVPYVWWGQAIALTLLQLASYLAPVVVLFTAWRSRAGLRGLHDRLLGTDVIQRSGTAARASGLGSRQPLELSGHRVERDGFLGRDLIVVPASAVPAYGSPRVVQRERRDGRDIALLVIPEGSRWREWLASSSESWPQVVRVLAWIAGHPDLRSLDVDRMVVGRTGRVHVLPRGVADQAWDSTAEDGGEDGFDAVGSLLGARGVEMPWSVRESLERAVTRRDPAELGRAATVAAQRPGSVTGSRRLLALLVSAGIFYALVLVQHQVGVLAREARIQALYDRAAVYRLGAIYLESDVTQERFRIEYSHSIENSQGSNSEAQMRAQIRALEARGVHSWTWIGPIKRVRTWEELAASWRDRATTLESEAATRLGNYQRTAMLAGDSYETTGDIVRALGEPPKVRLCRRIVDFVRDDEQSIAAGSKAEYELFLLLFPPSCGLLFALIAWLTRGQLPFRLAGLRLIDARGCQVSRWRAAWHSAIVFVVTAFVVWFAEWANRYPAGSLVEGLLFLGIGVVSMAYPLLAVRFPGRLPHDVIAGTRVVPV